MKTTPPILLALLVLTVWMAGAQAGPPSEPAALKQADRLFKDQNWAEARVAYDKARDQERDWHTPAMRRAVEGAAACAVKLSLWEEAVHRLEECIAHNRESVEEVAGQRLLAALYLSMPSNRVVDGDRFERGESGRYPDEDTAHSDGQEAVRRLERARDVAARLAAVPPVDAAEAKRLPLIQELIGIDFDLAAALTGELEDEPPNDRLDWWLSTGNHAANDVEDDNSPEAQTRRAEAELRYRDEPAVGIPRRPDGQPRFPETPAVYGSQLSPAEKFRFLLVEVERLDISAHRDDAAQALLRRFMISRLFYGPETATDWLDWWQRGNGYRCPPPIRPSIPATKVWELQENQALTPVGGRLEVVDLPADESPLALVGALTSRYPQSTIVPEARFTRAVYHQSRQQFPQALAEYRALIQDFPTHARAAAARAQIQAIEQPVVVLDSTGVHLPGVRPRLAFTARNAGAVEFTARRFEPVRYAEEHGIADKNDLFKDNAWKKYLGQEPSVTWSETLPGGQGNRAVEGSTLASLESAGAYIVEARVAGGKEPSRVVVLVSDLLLLRKNIRKGDTYENLFVACDARTGQPLPERVVRVYEQWEEEIVQGGSRKGWLHRLDRLALVTDANGVVVYRCKHPDQSSQVAAALVGEGGRIAFVNCDAMHAADFQPPDPLVTHEGFFKGFLTTDRPVYRPGATVHYCLWLRRERDGVYRLPPDPVQIEIKNPHHQRVELVTLTFDEAGAASGEWTVGPDAPLGNYSVEIAGDSTRPDRIANQEFRVEEYRQPEFEVNVRPAAAQARLGEEIKATIEARYYFGAPVTAAKVSYSVYRETFDPAYFQPAEYDWLYGKGYGQVFYPYPWLPWWERWGNQIGWGGDTPSQPPGDYPGSPRWEVRERVAQGTGTLDADGKFEVEIDTARAKAERGDHDHRYTVEATVRGASRRTVEAQGSLVATRQEFYAYVETDHAWYTAGNEARVLIRTLTPGNVPVAAKGQVVVSRVRFGGANHDEMTEEEEKRWDADTDPDGRLSFTYSLASEGQYHVAFLTRDSWRQEVRGNTVFWVNGPKFDDRASRFNELEIIPDKRSYRVGETAHLLVNTAGDHAHVLFATGIRNGALESYRFIDVPGRSVVVDVPIDEGCAPNTFVEATVVSDGRVRTESCELIVPPERKLLHVALRTDKPAYLPGEKGAVHIEATDYLGKPAKGEVTLTAFDKAVTYIQPEAAEMPGVVFHGERNTYEAVVDSSFEQAFGSVTILPRPQDIEFRKNAPEGWYGSWEVGVGASATPLWRALRSDGTDAADRVIVTGSDIPPAENNGIPRYGMGASGVDALLTGDSPSTSPGIAGLKGVITDPSGRYPGRGSAGRSVEPEIRTRFADTALWLPALQLDAKGAADAEITFPQSLTTWRVHGYAVNADTQVGDATAEATTAKKLLVRLLSPRFFTERDEAVLSAAANNYLPEAQDVTAELILPAAQFQPTEGAAGEPDADGNLHLTAHAGVAPGSEHRFDWLVKVLRPGLAMITARALTAQESDGVRLAFPVQVHGASRTLVQSGSMRVDQDGDHTLHIDVPAEIDPEQTQLEISLSASLAGVMIDALPYLANYPYGCVEQTMSRFYPSVLVRDTLKRLGMDLEALGNQRRQMNPADLTSRFGDAPVYDSERLERMIREGLASLYNFQIGDGGWGWWHDEEPSPFQTAYVLQGLQAAKGAGVTVDEHAYNNGFRYLRWRVNYELAVPEKKRGIGDTQEQAYLAYVVTLEPEPDDDKGTQSKWLDRLYTRRGDLNNYGRALLALALHHANRDAQARTVLRNLLQFVEHDDSNETAWVRTPSEGWWFWWNNDIETNAWALKALVALDPKNDLAPRLVKWLLNNRRNGSYWSSTRDTAQVIAAMTDYLIGNGEGTPDCTLAVSIDGQAVRQVHVTRENLFAFDNRVLLRGLQLKPGPHDVVIHKDGVGALYYSCRLTYFTREEGVKAAGSEIAIERSYFKLVSKATAARSPAGALGDEPPDAPGFTRERLQDGDELTSGDGIEVVLKISAKNTYDYLAFEDRKPAGCEPVDVRSGERWADGFCANVELRDTKTVFFVALLEQGEHWLRYRLRAETPGKFHALPATAAAMYAPEVRANSDEMRLNIRD